MFWICSANIDYLTPSPPFQRMRNDGRHTFIEPDNMLLLRDHEMSET